jgi:hypothetical protein
MTNENSQESFESKVPHVLVEGNWIEANKTEFLNISEDLFGRDVYEFKYNGKCYSSYVIMKYKNT